MKLLILALLLLAQSTWSVTEVTDLTTLPADLDSSLRLSPDGTLAAWGNSSEGLCIHTFADAETKCTDWPPDSNIRLDRLAMLTWSPDSSQIAFYDNFFLMFHEPDIWVYDVASGTFTNRTPDDAFDVNLGENNNVQLDYAPAWGVNGELYFFRSSDANDAYTLELYRLLPDSDTPEQVGDYSREFPTLSVYLPPAVSPDGTQMAVIVLGQDPSDPNNGLWLINLDDGSAEMIADTSALKAGFPEWQEVMSMMPAAVNWAGANALVVAVFDPQVTSTLSQNYYYIDLETNAVTSLVDLTDIESMTAVMTQDEEGYTPGYRVPRLGIVTPDALIYAHFDLSQDTPLSLSAVTLPPDGSEPTPLGTFEDCSIMRLPGGYPNWLVPVSAANSGLIYNCLVELAQP